MIYSSVFALGSQFISLSEQVLPVLGFGGDGGRGGDVVINQMMLQMVLFPVIYIFIFC